MNTVLLLIDHRKNRYLLAQWLKDAYHVLSPTIEGDLTIEGKQLLTKNFDICLVDFAAIRKLRKQMLAKRESAIPTFLPFVFLTTLQDIGFSTDHLEDLIDDIIYIPIQKIELETRLRILWRSRSYSLQLKSAQAELNEALVQEKELNLLKSQFVSTVSHEFRNPLNSISGMAQLLKAYGDKLPPEKKAEILAGLQRNVTKMTNLLEDVLTISRKDMGKLKLNLAPLKIEAFCRGLINEIQTVFNNKQSIDWIYKGEANQQFNLDSKLLHHILINLLSNACKYSPKDSVIDFEVSNLNSDIIFTIRDRGIGIPAADIPHLFDSFYRASNSEGYQGTGLGLAIVKQYVELHRGSITVTSELEVGTVFTVTIPVNY